VHLERLGRSNLPQVPPYDLLQPVEIGRIGRLDAHFQPLAGHLQQAERGGEFDPCPLRLPMDSHSVGEVVAEARHVARRSGDRDTGVG